METLESSDGEYSGSSDSGGLAVGDAEADGGTPN